MAGIDWMLALPMLAAVLGLAAAGAWWARRHALWRGLLDQPGERRSHRVATPRGGGIGIAVAWALACVALWSGGSLPGPIALAAATGVVLVGGAGYADDHRPLSAWWRLAAHLAAGVVLAAGLAATGAEAWLVVLTLASVPVLVNVWNFMDGIDGLATSQATLAALGFAMLAKDPGTALVALALSAACLGFLPFNFPRARIFLGDVGSGVLGFALAALAGLLLLPGGERSGPGLLPVLFLPLSAFLVDASLTLGRRIVQREQWWQAHVGHAYQQAAARCGSHVPVTLAFGAWTALAVVVGEAAAGHGIATRMAAAGGCLMIGTLAWRVIAVNRPYRKKERP